MLIDSHCHLDRVDLERHDHDLSNALKAAAERGVEGMLCVNIDLAHRSEVLALAEKYPQVLASTGVHPMDVASGVPMEADLLKWGEHPKVVAFGETGLDYYYSEEHKELQRESFALHLCAGVKADLPVIVHTRSAKEDTLAIIRECGGRGVLHCFTEDWDMAKQAMDEGFYISIAGIVTFKNASELRDVVSKIPLDRLLVETDSPYLAPVPHRGKSNEPAFVREVAEYIAELKGLSFPELAAITSENFFTLFNKAKPHFNRA